MNYVGQEDSFYYHYKTYLNKNNNKNECDFIKEELYKIDIAAKEYKILTECDSDTLFKKLKDEDYRNVNKQNNFTSYDIENYCKSFLNFKYRQYQNASSINKSFLLYKLKHFESIYSVKIDKTQDDSVVKNQPMPKENKHLSKNWFKIGVKFATGEVQKIYKENNCVATKTAMQLGNKNLRPYISESISNTNINDKNIFSRKQKDIDLIIKYCNENSLTICDDFNNKLPNQPT